jgi:hypothetical protein
MKKFFVFFIIFFPSSLFSVSITGTQGYSAFGLDMREKFSLASVMSAGVRFNKYFEIRYLSLDTSLRMPVLPFRVIDVKYNKHITSDNRVGYLFFDSDIIGAEFSYPLDDYLIFSFYYGIGRGKMSEVTMYGSPDNLDSIIRRQDIIHVVNPSIKTSFTTPLGKALVFLPTLGAMVFYMGDKLQFKRAYAFYLALSLFYEL